MGRSVAVGAALIALCVPAVALADIPVIQHDPIGCIVAGEFPRLDACFTPVDNVTRPRAYFKSETGTAWYWVDFKQNTAPVAPAAGVTPDRCYSAILPKPTRKITGLIYYLEVSNPQFEQARLDDKHVRVVPEKGGCRKDEPLAATVPNAIVAVGAAAGAPAIPVGFAVTGIAGAAGGVSAGVVAAAVVGGGAAVAGGAAIASSGKSTPTRTASPTATFAPTSTSTLPPATATPTATPTTAPNFNAVITVAPTEGPDPLEVTFDTCASTGQNLRYAFDFDGDGTVDLSSGVYCRVGRFYHADGTVSSTRYGSGVKLQAVIQRKGCTTDFMPSVTVREAVGGGGSTTQPFLIQVDDPLCGDRTRTSSESSSLRVAGATALVGSDLAQIVLNGETPLTVTRGHSTFTAGGRSGTNRIELRLAQGAGPGSVSFDLQATTKLIGGSLKVVAGDVTAVSGNGIAFRLNGKSGETVIFTFDVAP
jgi:hypothetical protein